jgi:hypothetical protein
MELTAEQICHILKACGESGVSKLKFAGLEAEFYKIAQSDILFPDAQPLPEAEISQAQAAESEKEGLRWDEIRLKTERLAAMLVEDPAQYEKLLLDGDLTDA